MDPYQCGYSGGEFGGGSYYGDGDGAVLPGMGCCACQTPAPSPEPTAAPTTPPTPSVTAAPTVWCERVLFATRDFCALDSCDDFDDGYRDYSELGGVYIHDGTDCNGRPRYVCDGCRATGAQMWWEDVDGDGYWYVAPSGFLIISLRNSHALFPPFAPGTSPGVAARVASTTMIQNARTAR